MLLGGGQRLLPLLWSLCVAWTKVRANPLPVLVNYFPLRLWSFEAIALALSFVLSHLSYGGRLVESHSVARVAWRRTVACFFFLLLLPGVAWGLSVYLVTSCMRLCTFGQVVTLFPLDI